MITTRPTTSAEHARRLDQQQREDHGDDRQQRHEPEHGPVPQPPHPDRAHDHQPPKTMIPAARRVLAADSLDAGHDSDRGSTQPSSAASATLERDHAAVARPARSASALRGPRRCGPRRARPASRERPALAWRSRARRHGVARGRRRLGGAAAAAAAVRGRPRLRLRCANAPSRVRSAVARARARAIAPAPRTSVSARTTAIRAAPGAATGIDVARVIPPIAKNGCCACAAAYAHELEPDRRAARLGRGRVDRPDADVVDVGAAGTSICSGLWVDRPISRSRPTSSRAASTGASSCPTCTPSASIASTRSGRSLTISSASCSAQRRRSGDRRR